SGSGLTGRERVAFPATIGWTRPRISLSNCDLQTLTPPRRPKSFRFQNFPSVNTGPSSSFKSIIVHLGFLFEDTQRKLQHSTCILRKNVDHEDCRYAHRCSSRFEHTSFLRYHASARRLHARTYAAHRRHHLPPR
ncbi:hypothetical protein EJ06DRAFT_579480, partial [Trichodelitschia bisporula]